MNDKLHKTNKELQDDVQSYFPNNIVIIDEQYIIKIIYFEGKYGYTEHITPDLWNNCDKEEFAKMINNNIHHTIERTIITDWLKENTNDSSIIVSTIVDENKKFELMHPKKYNEWKENNAKTNN